MYKQCLRCKKKARLHLTTEITFAKLLSMKALKNAFDFPGFVPAYIRPLFCEGKGPFRWVALSGDPEDIYKTDEVILREFADNEHLCNWIHMARQAS